jgi:hypothetical protein
MNGRFESKTEIFANLVVQVRTLRWGALDEAEIGRWLWLSKRSRCEMPSELNCGVFDEVVERKRQECREEHCQDCAGEYIWRSVKEPLPVGSVNP